MPWPSIEQVTREVIRRLQDAMGDDADVYAAGGATAIEVVASDGTPAAEVQDKPKLSLIGPDVRDSGILTPTEGAQGFVSKDTTANTYVSAPAPRYRDLGFQVVGYSVRETVSADGAKGLLWLMDRFDLFRSRGIGAPRILGDDWPTADVDGWTGYHFTGTPPRRIATAGGLHSFSASLTIRRVRLTDGTTTEGPLVMDGGATLDGPIAE